MVYAPTFTLSIPDCSLGMPSPTQRDGVNRRSPAPPALRTIGAALVNRSTAYRIEVLHAGWRSFMFTQTGAGTPTAPLGEVRRVSACSGGVLVSGVPHDSSNATLPSQVEVRRWPMTTATSVLRRFAWMSDYSPLLATALPPTLMSVPILGNKITGGLTRSAGDVGPVVLREGEGLAVCTPHNTGNGTSSTALACGPWSVVVTLRVVSTGAIFDYAIHEVVAGYENCAFGIFNGSGSSVVLEVLQVVAQQTTTLATGYATPEAPKVGLFHARKHAQMVVDVDGLVRDVSANSIIAHDTSQSLASGIAAYAGAMPFNMFEHADPSAFGFYTNTGSFSFEGGADPSSMGRIRRCYPWTCPANTRGPLYVQGLGRGGDLLRSRASARGSVEPMLLQPGEALGIGHSASTAGFHSQELPSVSGAWIYYIGDVEVTFRVVPLRGKPEVRAA